MIIRDAHPGDQPGPVRTGLSFGTCKAAAPPARRRRPSGPAGRRSETTRVEIAAAVRTGRCCIRNARTSPIVNRPCSASARRPAAGRRARPPGSRSSTGSRRSRRRRWRRRRRCRGRRGREVVAGDGEAVLGAGDVAAGRVEVGGGLFLRRSMDHDAEGQGDERREDGDVDRGVADRQLQAASRAGRLVRVVIRSSPRSRREACQRPGRTACRPSAA